jgi:hypothetical protein
MSRNGNRPGEGAAHSVGNLFDASEATFPPNKTQAQRRAGSDKRRPGRTAGADFQRLGDPAPTKQGAVRAQLLGSNQTTAHGVTVSGRNAPVLALCRALIEAGHDPDTPLEAYRGDLLCLRVRSIGEGARLTVEDGSDGRPRFRKLPIHRSPNADESVDGRPQTVRRAV